MLKVLKRTISRHRDRHKVAKANLSQIRGQLAKAKKTAAGTMTARDIVQALVQEAEQKVHGRLAAVVSKCLSAVFDEPYVFEIKFEKKRGRTDAVLLFRRNDEEIDPMTASGGGVIDIAAFALRVASIVMSMPQKRRLLILDEPFKFVSVDLRPAVKVLIETLSKELNIQFIIVTHMPELTIGKVIEL